MQTITFCSFKGGTSKTSTALNLGTCLAKFHGKTVLLIDFDAQANLSIGLGIGPDSEKTMVTVLQEDVPVGDVIQETGIDGLYVVPAKAYLDGVEKSLALGNDPYAHERLRRALKPVSSLYDFCLIDTPPSLGWLTQSACFASSHTIICAIPEAFSIIALRRLRDFQDQIEKYHKIDVLGVVLSFWDKGGATNQPFLEEIETFFPEKMFTQKVRRDIAVSRAVLQGGPVVEVVPHSRGALDYQALTKEFLERAVKMEAFI